MGLVRNHRARLRTFSGGFVEARYQTSGSTAGAGRGPQELVLSGTLQGHMAEEVGH